MKFTIILALICSLEAIPVLDKKWEQFKVDFDKTYATLEEEAYRKSIFESTLQYHESHNKLFRQGLHTHDVDVNQFSDWTAAEFEKYLSPMDNINMSWYHEMSSPIVPLPYVALPDSLDWRTSGGVTPVKNQGQCGSCWAFSTVGSVESAELIKNKQQLSLSEQQLVDCDKRSSGCNGGYPDTALSYVQSTGLESESAYPYTAKNGACNNQAAQTHTRIASAHSLSHPVPENTLMTALQTGPVIVLMDASGSDFQNYKSGIISTGSKSLNHAVLAVGYTSNSWIIKNSWGTSWGQAGYFQIARGNDVRGISEYGYYPSA